jgi:2-polyprenyl-3-methyl-5-hydroxy-6-metoxy-1,4-benzoquinol methylase
LSVELNLVDPPCKQGAPWKGITVFGTIRRQFSTLAVRLIPQIAKAKEVSRWETLWKVETARAEEHLTREVPQEVIEACESGWFPQGGRVLDIGSGRGQIAAWLGKNGYKVLAVDVAPSATELAIKHFGDIESVEYRTFDISSESLDENCFDILIDKGCFHVIPKILRSRFMDHISHCAAPGACYMLFHQVQEKKPPDQVIQTVKKAFADRFDIISHAQKRTPHIRAAGVYPRRQKPGMVFKMIRKND